MSPALAPAVVTPDAPQLWPELEPRVVALHPDSAHRRRGLPALVLVCLSDGSRLFVTACGLAQLFLAASRASGSAVPGRLAGRSRPRLEAQGLLALDVITPLGRAVVAAARSAGL